MTEPTTLSRSRGSRVYCPNLVAEVAQQMMLTNLAGYIKPGKHRVAGDLRPAVCRWRNWAQVASDSTEIISLMFRRRCRHRCRNPNRFRPGSLG